MNEIYNASGVSARRDGNAIRVDLIASTGDWHKHMLFNIEGRMTRDIAANSAMQRLSADAFRENAAVNFNALAEACQAIRSSA